MDSGLLAFMEVFIILGFALGWGVLELVGLRMDRRRRELAEAATKVGEGPPS
jgi:hypothetical protein